MYDRQDVRESEYVWLPGSFNYGPPPKVADLNERALADEYVDLISTIAKAEARQVFSSAYADNDIEGRVSDLERKFDFCLVVIFILSVLAVFACCRAAEAETLKGGIKCRGVHIHTISATYPITVKRDGYIGIREDWQRRIVKIHPDSPAEKSGLKVGDVILEVDGKKNGEIIGPVGTVVEIVVERFIGLRRELPNVPEVPMPVREHILIRRVPKSQIKPYGASPESKHGELTGEYWSNT